MINTAFVFLTLVDYSLDQHVLSALEGSAASGPVALPMSNPLVSSLGTYYSWRIGGAPLLKYWDLLIACTLPLVLFGGLMDNVDTLRQARRAPLVRHLLDAECLIQLLTVLYITLGKAAPATAKLVDAVMGGQSAAAAAGLDADADALPLVRELANFHFLLFVLNLLQFFVPFLRLNAQKKQDAIIAMEAEVDAIVAAKKATAAAASAATAGANAATPASTAETSDELRKRK